MIAFQSTPELTGAAIFCVFAILSFHAGLVLAVSTFVLWIVRIALVIGAITPLALVAIKDTPDPSLHAMISVVCSVALLQLSLIASLVRRARRVDYEPKTIRRKTRRLITDVEGDHGSP